MPGVMEADDLGTWVVKLRGAGQGLKVLVAEVLVGEIARRLGLHMPELTVVDLSAQIARYEADEEVQDLLDASVGTNLGIDLLPGAFAYDGSKPPPAAEAAGILWLDAFTANIDRTPSNPNLIRWHGQTWLIDHGAALYFHHSWPSRAPSPERFAAQRFDDSSHVLRDVASGLDLAHEHAVSVLDDATLREVVDLVPDEWLEPTEHLPTTADVRAAYLDLLTARRDSPDAWRPQDLA